MAEHEKTACFNAFSRALCLCAFAGSFCMVPGCATTSSTDSGTPSSTTHLAGPARMAWVRESLRAGDEALRPAVENLLHAADEALQRGPYSVVNKPLAPRSGDKHDYMSVSPYWWPNPETKDGLPYVRRDGEFNPEREKYDNAPLHAMSRDVETLALAYYFSGEEAYASHAANLLRTWFLDPATRMNPNLRYAQAIPGYLSGRAAGIIDALCLPYVAEAAIMLRDSNAWTSRDHQALVHWFREFLHWLTTSPQGRSESRADNNHATCFDLQVVSYALFVGDRSLALETLRRVGPKRIAPQIEPDGRQPEELARTRSYSYSVKNLEALTALADIGDDLGMDLWHFETSDGRSIQKALDYVVENALIAGNWPHQQLGGVKPSRMLPVLQRAAIGYREEAYQDLADALGGADWAHSRAQLILPRLNGAAGPNGDHQ